MKDEQVSPGVQSIAIIKSETLLILMVTAATYLYTFASQRAYLASFGVDEIFTSVAIEDVLRTGLWLFAVVFIALQLIQLPANFLGWFFMCIWFTRSAWLPVSFGIAIFSTSGATWLSMSAFGFAVLAIVRELHFLWKCRRQGMTLHDAFQRDVVIQYEYLKRSGDEKISELFGSSNWTIVVALLILPYGIGSMVGERVAESKVEFLEFTVAEENYLVVHQDSGVFVSVGYDQSGEEKPMLTGRIRIMTAEKLSQSPLLEKTFKSGLLRELPRDKPSVSDWFRSDVKSLFGFGNSA